MGMDNKIKAFLARKSKAAIVLELLLNREFVTASDIINYNCEDLPIVFTTSPHKLIEIIRERFGVDFVKDVDIAFFRTMYTATGKPYKISDTYKKYFLNKVGDNLCLKQ